MRFYSPIFLSGTPPESVTKTFWSKVPEINAWDLWHNGQVVARLYRMSQFYRLYWGDGTLDLYDVFDQPQVDRLFQYPEVIMMEKQL